MDTSMEIPGLFGWFHFLWLGITALSTYLLCRFGKHNQKSVILITSIIVIVLEIYKQINFSFSYEDGIAFDYQWYAFPFQFCSTPMYIGLLAGLTRGKVHNALCCYLSTFALFAGICVMIYPADVYIDTIGINIQTMVCHGSMVTIGLYLLITGYVDLKHSTVLKGSIVFGVCVIIAATLNEIAHATGLEETFNMFFVSPYWDCTLPVYNLVHGNVPFPINLLIYVAGFTAASWIILLLAMAVYKLSRKKNTAIA